MAEVTGPISTLPGAGHDLPDGAMCDSHPDRPAVARLQGETDSFGAELIDCCEECRAAWRAYDRSAEARTGNCDWCKSASTDLRYRRDIDEGMYGPVYPTRQLCGEQNQAQLQRAAAGWDARYGLDA